MSTVFLSKQPSHQSPASTPCSRGDRERKRQSDHSLSFLEWRILESLSWLRHGELTIRYFGTERRFGEQSPDRLTADVTIHDRRFFQDIAFSGSLGAAEAWLDGYWSCDDLTALLRLFCRNLDASLQMDTGLARLGMWLAKGAHWLASNTRSGSRRNIAAHYDLGNELFRLFLDDTMMYSSGYFTDDNQSLRSASEAKLELICRKLNLRAEDRILEIGTGWGGFATHAARNYGCHVTTTTISREQFQLASERIQRAGLEDRVHLLLSDYRDLTGSYDHIVSIEMIEAVGHRFLPSYFQCCDRLLKPQGNLLIQAITMPDQRYQRYCRQTDFIQKYIFPGGHLPSIGAMQAAIAQGTRLVMTHGEQFPDSYAGTLRHWRARFFDRIDEVRALGYDDRFIRMWDYYLCYCEAAFLERAVSVGQFVWEKTRY